MTIDDVMALVISLEVDATYYDEDDNETVEAIERARAAVRAAILALLAESDGPWKAAVIEGLVVSHCIQPEHETDPRKALADLILWHVMVALDPSVSSDAVKLLDAEAEACANVCECFDASDPRYIAECIRARIDARKGGKDD